jgi:hypothetical protein
MQAQRAQLIGPLHAQNEAGLERAQKELKGLCRDKGHPLPNMVHNLQAHAHARRVATREVSTEALAQAKGRFPDLVKALSALVPGHIVESDNTKAVLARAVRGPVSTQLQELGIQFDNLLPAMSLDQVRAAHEEGATIGKLAPSLLRMRCAQLLS